MKVTLKNGCVYAGVHVVFYDPVAGQVSLTLDITDHGEYPAAVAMRNLAQAHAQGHGSVPDASLAAYMVKDKPWTIRAGMDDLAWSYYSKGNATVSEVDSMLDDIACHVRNERKVVGVPRDAVDRIEKEPGEG